MSTKRTIFSLVTTLFMLHSVLLGAPQQAVRIEKLTPISEPVSLIEIQGTGSGNVMLAGKFQNKSSQQVIVKQGPSSGMSYGGGFQKAALQSVPITLAEINAEEEAHWFIDTLYTYPIPPQATITQNIKWLCLNLYLPPPPEDKTTAAYHFFNTDTTEKYRLVPDVVRGIARFNHFLQDTSDLMSRVWIDKQEDAIYFSGYSNFSTDEWYLINNCYLKPDLTRPHPNDPTSFSLDSIYVSVYTANWAIWAVTDGADSIVLREKLTEWNDGVVPSQETLKMTCYSIYKMLMYAGLPEYAKKFKLTPIPANHAEGFEDAGFPPFLWQISNRTSSLIQWEVTSGLDINNGQIILAPRSGDGFSYIQWDSNNDVDSWLITPEICFDNSGSFRVSFWECGVFWSAYGKHHRILYTSGNPDPAAGKYRVIKDWTPANHSLGNDWQSVELNLDSLRVYNKIYLAFQYTGRDADLWAIDDIHFSGTGPCTAVTTFIMVNNKLPDEYLLSQNYPNPFNSATLINYRLPKQSKVVVTIYNILGQEVSKLVDEVKPAGFHQVSWEGKNSQGQQLGSGVYFYKMTAGEFVQVKRLLLLE